MTPRDANNLRHGTFSVSALLLVLATLLTACGGGSAGSPPTNLGTVENQPLPKAIQTLPLTNQHGAALTLASFHGKTVMLVPFMTLCTEICPLTTGNLLQVQHALADDGAASKVKILELSGDPGRDTPQRLAAYARLTGAPWEMATEPDGRNAIMRFFGFYFEKVPADNPPPVDWWTGKPLTYDVLHATGYVLIDPQGRARFITGASPAFRGTLNPTLHRFLTAQGRRNLVHPSQPDWTPSTALQTLGWMLHRTLAD